MHESLKVYLKDSFVGWLSHESTGDEFSFKYDDSYLANPVDGALSFALPHYLSDCQRRTAPVHRGNREGAQGAEPDVHP